MREIVREAVKDSNSLDQVRDNLFIVFRRLQNEGHKKIGYVSGLITSEGPENIGKNIKRLTRFTDQIRSQSEFPVFGPTDVFDDALFRRLEANGFHNADWMVFWQEVLSGNGTPYVTDIYMTPRWKTSQGSVDEHKTAQAVGMEIHYLEKEV